MTGRGISSPDAIVTKEADDLNRWEASIHVRPSSVTSIPLSPATIRKAKYFARMHKLRGYRAWLKQIIEERIRIEETVLTEVKQELRKESRRLDLHSLRELSVTERSLQVTYRKGRPFAAYLYLSRKPGEKSVRTEPSPDGLLVIDYGADGRPIGVEITASESVTLDRLNTLLKALGQPPLPEQEFRPLSA